MAGFFRGLTVHTLGGLLLALVPAVAHAAVRTWDGGAGDGRWDSAANWNPDGFAATDNLTVSSSVTLGIGSAAVDITGNASLTIAEGATFNITTTGDLRLRQNTTMTLAGTLLRTSGSTWARFGDDANHNITVYHTGAFASSGPLILGFVQNTGSGQANYLMSAGTITASAIQMGWTFGPTAGSETATFVQSGTADVNLSGELALGRSRSTAVGTGTYRISGGTLDAFNVRIGDEEGGQQGTSVGNFVQSGGTIGASTRPYIYLSKNERTTGNYTMSGGTLQARSLTDSGSAGFPTLKIQGGAGSIDVSEAFSLTGVNATVIAEVGSSGLTPIRVTGTGTADVGASTDLKVGVYGAVAYPTGSRFPVLQLASGSITGSFVDQTGPLWDLSATSNEIAVSLAPDAKKPQFVLSGQTLSGLNDQYGWLEVLAGSYPDSSVPLGLALSGSGSAVDLAAWMSTAGLDATGNDASQTIVLHNLPTPSTTPRYLMWDFRDYNAAHGTSFAVAGVFLAPEPSALLLAIVGLLGLGVVGSRRRSSSGRGPG